MEQVIACQEATRADVRVFERWITGHMLDSQYERKQKSYRVLSDEYAATFIDLWGHNVNNECSMFIVNGSYSFKDNAKKPVRPLKRSEFDEMNLRLDGMLELLRSLDSKVRRLCDVTGTDWDPINGGEEMNNSDDDNENDDPSA